MKIECIKFEEIHDAGLLLKEVFDEFVSPDYSKNGVYHFYEIIGENSIRERFINGNQIFIAKDENQIAGYVEIKNLGHIYLLFVKKKFHRKGIARRLIQFSLNVLKEYNPGIKELTVNSSPYALQIYERLGFVRVADYQIKNGIISFPMKLKID